MSLKYLKWIGRKEGRKAFIDFKPNLSVGKCFICIYETSGQMERIGIQPFENCTAYDLRPSMNCSYPSKEHEIIFLLLKQLHVPYQIVPITGKIGQKIEGKWVGGMLGALENGTLDVIARLMWQTPELNNDFGFSHSIIDDQVIIEIGKSKVTDVSGSALLMFKAFGPWIWLIFSFLYVATWFLAHLKLGHRLINVLQETVILSGAHKNIGFRLFFVIVGLGACLFINLYQNLLFATLMRLPQKQLYDGPWELLDAVEKGKLTLVSFNNTTEDTLLNEAVLASNTDFGTKLRNVITKRPPLYVEDHDYKIVDKLIATGKYIHISYQDFISKDWMENNCVGVQVSVNPYLPTFRRGFIFRKSWPLADVFNQAITQKRMMIDNVLNRYKRRSERRTLIQCATASTNRKAKPLEVAVFVGPFICLVIVSIFASICLMLERHVAGKEGEKIIVWQQKKN